MWKLIFFYFFLSSLRLLCYCSARFVQLNEHFTFPFRARETIGEPLYFPFVRHILLSFRQCCVQHQEFSLPRIVIKFEMWQSNDSLFPSWSPSARLQCPNAEILKHTLISFFFGERPSSKVFCTVIELMKWMISSVYEFGTIGRTKTAKRTKKTPTLMMAWLPLP